MPLHVHPSSTCDVCQEEYYNQRAIREGHSNVRLPYSIPCGHVFCQFCLESVSRVESLRLSCPLCRDTFSSPAARKLHVDRFLGDGNDNNAEEEAHMLCSLTVAFEEDTPDQRIQDLLNDARYWLDAGEDAARSRSNAVQNMVRGLDRFRDIQRRAHQLQDMERKFNRLLDYKDQELRTERAQRERLLELNAEQDAKVTVTKLESSLKDVRTELGQLRVENKQLKLKYSNPSNPLPPPPVPVEIDWLAPAPRTRPPLRDTAEPNYGSKDSRQPHLLDAVNGVISSKPGSKLKLPLMVPGALPSQRVVLDEISLHPLLAESTIRPVHSTTFSTTTVADADETPMGRPSTLHDDVGSLYGPARSSANERLPPNGRVPRSRPYPIANSSENQPPAPGLGLFESSRDPPSTNYPRYAPAPMPDPDNQPLPATNFALSQSARQLPPLPNLPQNRSSSSVLVPESNRRGNDLGLVLPASLDEPSQNSSLSDLGLGLNGILGPASDSSSRNQSANSSLSNLGNLTSSLFEVSPVEPQDDISSWNPAPIEHLSGRASSSSDTQRPLVPALARSRNVNLNPGQSRAAMGRGGRRVSFDLDTRPFRRDSAEESPLPRQTVRARQAPPAPPEVHRHHPADDDDDDPSPVGAGLELSVPANRTLGSGQVITGLADLDHINRSLVRSLTERSNNSERRRPRPHYGSTSDVVEGGTPPNEGGSPILDVVPSRLGDHEEEPSAVRGRDWAFHRDTRTYYQIRERPGRRHSLSRQHTLGSSQDTLDVYPQAGSSGSRDDVPSIASSRHSRRRDPMPVPARDATPSIPGAVSNGSLLLNFTPMGPPPAGATTADGQPSGIHAPRPVNRQHNNNFFGLWDSRTNHH